jgi:opacity protein-like surface antigen
MLKTLAAGATLVGALTAVVAPATAVSAAPKSEMVIDVVSANGSGCPRGSADVTASPDNKAFTVTYSKFTAQVGPDSKPTDFRKNCQLALNVHVPQGYTYAVASTDYRGFARLERGASASESANYYFQGERQNTRIRHNFAGPMDGDWQRTDKVGIRSLSFLPCGEERYLNVNTELRVNRGSSSSRKTSMLTMDSTDGNLDTVYHLAWKKC